MQNKMFSSYRCSFFIQLQSFCSNTKMRTMTERSSLLGQQRSGVRSSDKKIRILKRLKDHHKTQNNYSSCSILPSNFRNAPTSFHNEYQVGQLAKPEDVSNLQMQYFTQKYLENDDKEQNIKDQLNSLLNKKRNQIQSLRVHRDEIKLITYQSLTNQQIKINMGVLRQKAEVQESLSEYKDIVEKQHRRLEKQLDLLKEYNNFIKKIIDAPVINANQNYQRYEQQQLTLQNLEQQKQLLIKQLNDEQKKNSRELKHINQQIGFYRCKIKEKEDRLRQLKAKICTMYIKLNSHNKSKTGLSKQKSMSVTIRNNNKENFNSLKQMYIGNSHIRKYATEIVEEIKPDQALTKIRFFIPKNQNEQRKKKQYFSFQCIYKNKEGIMHEYKAQQQKDNDATRDKMSVSSNQTCEEIVLKNVIALKFFFKAKMVGIECRIKSDKGNSKYVQIGNCSANVQHELFLLSMKKLITIGSCWHEGEMIGVMIYYVDVNTRITNSIKKYEALKKQAYEQYYS